MKNSKKGFTLIELLVTIILILSVLAVAIVSYIKISDNKKEQAYNSVKEEIIGAAKDYFYTKEYLFEGLEDGSSGIITVGKLVEEDYLNKVTDPRDGKVINTCSRVVVTKENGRYKTKYEEYKEGFSCDSDNSIILTEPGAPSLEVKVKTGKKGKNNWYKSSVVVLAEAKTDGNGAIVKTGICSNDVCNSYKDYNNGSSFEDNKTYANDTNEITTWYMAENVYGKKTFKGIKLGVDKTFPVVSVTMENSSWTNADKVKYTYEASDNLGLVSLVGYWNKSGLTYEEAEATNCWWNGTSYGTGDCLGKNSSNEITKIERYAKGSNYFSAQGYRKIRYKACDQAGNCKSDFAIARIDHEAPNVSVTMENSSWTNANKVKYTYEASDNLGLVSLVGYWNKSQKTKTEADSDNCKWNGTSYGTGDCLGKNSSNEITKIERYAKGSNYFSAQGYRKIRYKACDQAGNCKSDFAIARIDHEAPNVSVTMENSSWTNADKVKYTYEASDNLGLASLVGYWNKSDMTEEKSNKEECSWKGSSYGTGNCSGNNGSIKVSSGVLSVTGSNYFYDEGHRKIRYIACDLANNCKTSEAAIARIDRTPPEFVSTGSGYVWCKTIDEKGYLAHGYSAKFKDNLSGATLKIVKYYSSWDCGGSDTGGFYEAGSNWEGKTSIHDHEAVNTSFAGCKNNPSPWLRYSLVDAAGNRYKDQSGNYYKELKHSSGSISSSNNQKCNGSVWYNKTPNR